MNYFAFCFLCDHGPWPKINIKYRNVQNINPRELNCIDLGVTDDIRGQVKVNHIEKFDMLIYFIGIFRHGPWSHIKNYYQMAALCCSVLAGPAPTSERPRDAQGLVRPPGWGAGSRIHGSVLQDSGESVCAGSSRERW